ncbi:MAG: DUF2075 domain-containing protein [Lachnospiraceae bacterium]|nr:DUF2075 domain-containing protein [Lachnospiraceae bacterium]
MYRITDGDFHKEQYGSEKYLQNWPMLYILENGKTAYVGQSNHVLTRMKQHKGNPEKDLFDAVHFIYSKEFNQSVTLDYEAKLIQLFAADEKYVITNRNEGIADKEYFNKEYYDEHFTELWDRLRKSKLAKKTIDEIINSDLFKYSPFKELNDNQREAVDQITDLLRQNENQSIIVNGMPGSGKTIVAVFLLKFLKDDEYFKTKKIGIVIPQTSLRKTLKQLFKGIYGLKSSDVIGPSEVTKQKYDILLVDEAHRLHQRKNISYMGAFDQGTKRLGLPKNSDELDWILAQCKCPILFYDKDQVIGPSGITVNMVKDKVNTKFGNRMIAYYTLDTQMRVRGGNDYIDYVKKLLDGEAEAKKVFSGYEFKLVERFKDFNELMYQKEEADQLSRMVAGYAWDWISKNDKSLKDIEIEGISKMWNNRTEGWVHCPTAIDEVGCIHSIQGYDLNYAFVILGDDIYYDPEKQVIAVNGNHYFDKNGKKTATEEELLDYIKNVYYVLMTRGIKGTYLYTCDDALRKYLKKFIDVM